MLSYRRIIFAVAEIGFLFARERTYRHPNARAEINHLIALHSGSIYADRCPAPEELQPLALLWGYMEMQTKAE